MFAAMLFHRSFYFIYFKVVSVSQSLCQSSPVVVSVMKVIERYGPRKEMINICVAF